MSATVSRQICDAFAAAAVDLTPPDLRREVTLLFLPSEERDGEPQNYLQYGAILSDAERDRAGRLKTTKAKARFVKGRAFRRYCSALALRTLGADNRSSLSSLQFAETAEGRPYLTDAPEIWLSFSASSAGHLAAWSSSCAVGVDIEDAANATEAVVLARHYFSNAEADVVAHARAGTCTHLFLQLWTLKEAALKSIGQGLPYGLDAFEFALLPALRMVRAPAEQCSLHQMHSHLIKECDACAALVLRKFHMAVS